MAKELKVLSEVDLISGVGDSECRELLILPSPTFNMHF